MKSPVHRHPGVEAWYTLEGEQCLETPEGKLVQRAGGPGVMVPGGLPMLLTGTGSRRPPFARPHPQDTGQPRSTVATDWTPYRQVPNLRIPAPSRVTALTVPAPPLTYHRDHAHPSPRETAHSHPRSR